MIKPVFTHEEIEELKYPTPYFVFKRKMLSETIQHYQQDLPGAKIFYALKANAEPQVLQTIYQSGCGFEAASAYELDFLKKIGVSPEKIIYGTSVKPLTHIKAFRQYGVDRFAFDSEPELEKIASVNPHARVYVRVLVDDTGSVFTMSEKFGVTTSAASQLMVLAKSKALEPYGISFNVGSQALNPEAWSNAINSLTPMIEELSKKGIKVKTLNLGGGYPNSYLAGDEAPPFELIADNIKKSLTRLPYELEIIIEPGRGLVAKSMALVVSVIAKIKRPNGHWLYLDAGAYNALLETMAYQGSLRYQVSALGSLSGPQESFILTGPTGDSLDLIDKEALLPASVDVGDKLLFHDTGAYSSVLATPFNGFPRVPLYVLD